MSSIEQRISDIKAKFSSHANWEDKYKSVIAMGKDLGDFPEEHRTEENKVKGCQSQVWIHSDFSDGRVIFYADSDASIVKGIIALLLNVYSDSTPDEILATKPEFLEEIGLRQHLSMSRANGLSSMLKQISMYALAYKTKMQMGLI
ncbi:SufE family protein [Halobacteriovorax sp. HLS]|uniref:SufE family protein n=1 Tax=Halobacteriovorax sp. HLS TaxID=2234000 RepID=UPI000FD9A50F|nr:SufE family protein [Halobacteriovorax sp. HLS]